MIYFIRGEYTKRIKIGFSIDIASRIQKLRTSSPDELNLLGYIFGSQQDEQRLHKKYRKYRMRGEWFKENKKLLDYIDENCLGGDKFTIEKLDKEYRVYLPYPHLIDNANILNLGGYHLKALADKKQEYIVGFQGSEKKIIKWLKDNGAYEDVLNEFGSMFKSFDNQTQTSNNDEETVSLIASGYEWTCPQCDVLNEEIEIPEKVKCAVCGKEFEVENADHAWG